MSDAKLPEEYKRRAAEARSNTGGPHMSEQLREGFLEVAKQYDRMAEAALR
jgi:hypothetical protein